MFEIPAALLSWLYGFTNGYVTAIALIAVFVMAITTPLTLKSTKGMLEMQRLSPEMRKLQNEYRNDRTKLNEEMMKLYQEHKVNPMASCLPLIAQMPVFIIMFRVLRGLSYAPRGSALPVSQAVWNAFGNAQEAANPGFIPRYLAVDSALYKSLFGAHSMPSLGLDLSKSAAQAITEGFGTGIWYALLVAGLGGLYFLQQRMVAARAAVSPTMSANQQKLMQYLPVFFALFQMFFLAALVIYYIFQTLLRIAQQAYITRAFYGHEDSIGRQAQRAGQAAREEAAKNDDSGGGGFFAQAKKELGGQKRDPEPKKSGSAGNKKSSPPGAKNKAAAKNTPADSKGGKGSKAGKAGKATSAEKTSGGKKPVSTNEPSKHDNGDKAGTDSGSETNTSTSPRSTSSKKVTPPKNRPTPSSRAKGRPTPARKKRPTDESPNSKSSKKDT